MKKQQKILQLNKKTSGNALVLALMIVAVTSAIAYALIESSTFSVRRTTQIHEMDTCRQAVHAAELHAGFLLHQPKGEGEMITDTQQTWAKAFEMQLAKDVQLQAQLSDLQGQFNINLLRKKSASGIYTPELIFSRLLIVLNIINGQTMQQALIDWVNNETAESDQVYLEHTPPYRPAHLPLSSISELALVQGFSEQYVELLTPFVSALPEEVNINVNTASPEVLAALLDTSIGSGRTLVNERMAYPFKNNQEFMDRAKAKAIAISDTEALGEMISVNSRYFLLKTVALCNKTTLISYSFIKRSSEGQARVYQRTQQL